MSKQTPSKRKAAEEAPLPPNNLTEELTIIASQKPEIGKHCMKLLAHNMNSHLALIILQLLNS
jgi:hypothetical protein